MGLIAQRAAKLHKLAVYICTLDTLHRAGKGVVGDTYAAERVNVTNSFSLKPTDLGQVSMLLPGPSE